MTTSRNTSTSSGSTGKVDPPFTVWITPSCLEKINMYATEAVLQKSSEIGGFARIEENGSDVFITDVFIPTQHATGAYFEISPEMDAEFMQTMMKAGKREEIKLYKSIFHSHPVGMSPSMSGVDVEAIKRRAEDGECYSLILSASRTCDSTKMFMHYCMNYKGKQMIFRDMPVFVGRDGDRMSWADELTATITKELLDDRATDSDKRQIQDAIRETICDVMPPTFEEDRKALRAQIAAEVAEKLPTRPKWTSGYQHTSGYKPNAQQALPVGRSGTQVVAPSRTTTWPALADLERQWKTVQRLHSIGYDKVDPENTNPKHFVTKAEAKKARKLHRRTITELNKKLRRETGIGVGDLVIALPEALTSNPGAVELMETPAEVEDFDFRNGLFSFTVEGDIYWSDELVVVTQYEDLMGWDDSNDPQYEELAAAWQ